MTTYKVLLAEDDEDDRYAFTLALKETNKTVLLSTATDGEELLKILYTSPQYPNLIILDNNMPKMDGLACLAEIRAKMEYKAIPIVMLSTSADKRWVDKARKYGASFYIQKPNNFEDLKHIVKFCLEIGTMPAVHTTPFFVVDFTEA
jgi:CheY-like chemotaxis protein